MPTRTQFMIILSSGLCAAALSVHALPVTIDGSALTGLPGTVYQVYGETGWVDGVSNLDLAPNTYTFRAYPGTNSFSFSVDGAGNVQYSPSLTFVSGVGTSTMTVSGFGVTVDGSALSGVGTLIWSVRYLQNWTSGAVVMNLIPGSYTFRQYPGTNPFNFTIDDSGLVQDVGALPFVSGGGTSTMTVDGVTFTVDGSAMTSLPGLAYSIRYIQDWSDGITALTVVPGSFLFRAYPGTNTLSFTVDDGGLISGTAAESWITGDGTNTLTYVGFGGTTIDGSALTGLGTLVYSVRYIQDWTAGVTVLDLMPGSYLFRQYPGTNSFNFTIDAAGLVQYSPSIGGVGGAGTNTLTIDGLQITVDGSALSGVGGLIYSVRYLQNWSSGVTSLTVLPGTFRFRQYAGTNYFDFTVDDDGLVQGTPSYASGDGTTTLTVSGVSVRIDAAAISGTWYVQYTVPTTTPSVLDLNVMPGSYSFRTTGAAPVPATTAVTIDGSGAWDYGAVNYLSGAGTTTLTVCPGACAACVSCDNIIANVCSGALASSSNDEFAQVLQTTFDAAMAGTPICEGSLACLQSILAVVH